MAIDRLITMRQPAFTVPESVTNQSHVLFSLRSGSASIWYGGEKTSLVQGQTLLVPAGLPHRIAVGPRTVLLPITVPEHVPIPIANHGSVHHLNAEWDNWLLHQFAARVSPLRDRNYRDNAVLTPMDRPRSIAPWLTMPHSPTAREVAHRLRCDPTIDWTLNEWAQRYGVGERTLRRVFVDETGLTFAAWRTSCRVRAGADLLRAGYSVDHAAGRAGFITTTGFIRAFTRQYGSTPTVWRRDHTKEAVKAKEAVHAEEAVIGCRDRLTHDSQEMITRLADSTPAGPPMIPAVAAAPRTYQQSSDILWMYHGTASVRVGSRTHKLFRGDAIWMPANTEHAVQVDADSIALPLVFAADDVGVTIDDAEVFCVPPSLNQALLTHVIANLTRLRPPDYHETDVLPLLSRFAIRRRMPEVTMPTSEVAQYVAHRLSGRPGDPHTLADWAGELGIAPSALNHVFLKETGKTFTAWRTTLRMRLARDLIARGMAPQSVARKVGYRHLSGFSRDFGRHHGLSPRAYQSGQ